MDRNDCPRRASKRSERAQQLIESKNWREIIRQRALRTTCDRWGRPRESECGGQEPGGKNLAPTSNARREEARGHPTPPTPPPPHPTTPHATLGDLSFSRRADAATGKKTARHGGKMCKHPSRPPRGRQTPPNHPNPPHSRPQARDLSRMAKLGRTLCAEKSKNARKPTPPTRAPKTKPNGGERTDDPAPEPPTPRRTGPRQARHGREEPKTTKFSRVGYFRVREPLGQEPLK